MPTRIPSYRPPRLTTSRAKRDDTTRPNAAARGYCDKAHRRWRQAVLTRDAWTCQDCGRVDPANHADHIVPIAAGGDRYSLANGQALCAACHGRKTLAEARAAR
jgi:5-methylcytosine-specific restriction endonuclease McrA